MRVFPAVLLTAVATLLSLHPVSAQPATIDQVKNIQAALKGRTLGLRGFSADPIATFTWNGTNLIAGSARLHALTLVTVDSVKLNGSKLSSPASASSTKLATTSTSAQHRQTRFAST